MKLSAILAPLLDRKADHETIRAVLLAYEAEQVDALEQRRKADAERQARKRSRDVTLRHSDRSLVRAGDVRVEDKSLTSEIEPQKKVKEARAARLPENWTLPVEWRADALAAKLPEHLIDLEASKMRDWSQSSPKGAKTNWRPAWRNWCREAAARASPQARHGPASPKQNPALDAANRLMEQLDAVSPSQTEANPAYPRLVAITGGG